MRQRYTGEGGGGVVAGGGRCVLNCGRERGSQRLSPSEYEIKRSHGRSSPAVATNQHEHGCYRFLQLPFSGAQEGPLMAQIKGEEEEEAAEDELFERNRKSTNNMNFSNATNYLFCRLNKNARGGGGGREFQCVVSQRLKHHRPAQMNMKCVVIAISF